MNCFASAMISDAFGVPRAGWRLSRAIETRLIELLAKAFGLEPLLDAAPRGIVAADAEHEECAAIGSAVEPWLGAAGGGVAAGLADDVRALVEPVRHAHFGGAAERFVHGAVDVLALAREVAVEERDEDANGRRNGRPCCSLVAVAADGRCAGHILFVVAVHQHRAARGERHEVGGLVMRPRARPGRRA